MSPRPHTGTILTVAVLLRLLTIWYVVARFPHNWLYGRGIELGTLAQSIAAGQGLSSPFGGSTGPTALLAPLYSCFIAGFFRVFGAFTLRAATAIMAAQLLFSVLTVLMIVQVAHRLFGVLAANLGGTFWAVSLPSIWMPTIFWETCLSTLFLVAMTALALRCQRKPGAWLWGLVGAYAGLAALVNPALLPAFVAMMGWTAWQNRHTLWYFPLSLFILALVYAPWPLRNARVLHAFIPARSTVGFEMWVGNRPGADGFLDEDQFPIFNRRQYDLYVTRGEVAYMHDKSVLARTYILAHPMVFLRLSTVRFVRFWTGTGNKDGSIIFTLNAVLTTTLGLLGIWRLLATGRLSLAVLFSLPLIVFPLPYYITHAEFRYRLVIDPLLTILAAYALSSRQRVEKP